MKHFFPTIPLVFVLLTLIPSAFSQAPTAEPTTTAETTANRMTEETTQEIVKPASTQAVSKKLGLGEAPEAVVHQNYRNLQEKIAELRALVLEARLAQLEFYRSDKKESSVREELRKSWKSRVDKMTQTQEEMVECAKELYYSAPNRYYVATDILRMRIGLYLANDQTELGGRKAFDLATLLYEGRCDEPWANEYIGRAATRVGEFQFSVWHLSQALKKNAISVQGRAALDLGRLYLEEHNIRPQATYGKAFEEYKKKKLYK